MSPRSVLATCLFACVFTGCHGKPREITIVSRNMAFHLDGQAAANPTLTLRAGEAITLRFRNDSPGVLHDLVIEPLGVATNLVATGRTTTVSFQVPDRPGRYRYSCRPHSLMMHGSLEVLPR